MDININLTKEFEKIAIQEEREISIKLNNGISKAADRLIEVYKTSPITPNDKRTKKNKYKDAFAKKTYKNVQYVGNTKTVKGKSNDEIPLSNILESDEKTQHIRKIFEQTQDELADIITNELAK